jgi:hypothetical protein
MMKVPSRQKKWSELKLELRNHVRDFGYNSSMVLFVSFNGNCLKGCNSAFNCF